MLRCFSPPAVGFGGEDNYSEAESLTAPAGRRATLLQILPTPTPPRRSRCGLPPEGVR